MPHQVEEAVEATVSAYKYFVDELEHLQTIAKNIQEASTAINWSVSANVAIDALIGILTPFEEDCKQVPTIAAVLTSAISSLKRAQKEVGWEEFADVKREGNPFSRLWKGLDLGSVALIVVVGHLKRLGSIVPELARWHQERILFRENSRSFSSRLENADGLSRHQFYRRVIGGSVSVGLGASVGVGIFFLVSDLFGSHTIGLAASQVLLSTVLPVILVPAVAISVRLLSNAAAALSDYHEGRLQSEFEKLVAGVNRFLAVRFVSEPSRGAEDR